MSVEDIDNLIAAKRQDLAYSFTFEDIIEGQTIILKGKGKDKDGMTVKVTSINEKTGTVYVKTTGSKPRAVNPIKKADIQNRIKFVYKPMMLDPELTFPEDELTEDDKAKINESREIAEELGDSFDDAWDSAESNTEDNLDDLDNCPTP